MSPPPAQNRVCDDSATSAPYCSLQQYYKRSEILEFHTTREQEALFEATFRAEGTLVRLERKQRCFNVSIGARGSRVCATAGARGELGECPSHPSPGGCTYTIEKNDSSYQRVQKFEASHATYRVCFALPTIGVHGAAAAPPPYAPLPPNGSHRMLASLHSLDGVARQPRTITTRRQAAALLDAAPGPGSKAHWGSQLALWATRPSDEVSCLGRVVANPCRQGSGAAAGGSAAAGGGNKSAAAAAVHAGLPGTGPAEWDEWSPLMPPAAAQ